MLGIVSRRWREPLWVWLVVLGTVFAAEAAVMAVLPWMLPDDSPRWATAAADAVLLTLVVAPVLWSLLVRPLREANRVRAEFLAELFRHIEADRRKTARDLHDGVGQALTVLVSGLRSASAQAASDDAVRRCADLKQMARQALEDVKRLALGLRPSLLDDLGLAPALERLVADLCRSHPVEVDLDAGEVAGVRLPEAVETAVFRIAQEALSNVVAHARASRVTVRVSREAGAVVLAVSDDGVGVPAGVRTGRRPGHLGLTGMRERATLLGGVMTLESAPGQGTRVVVKLPVGGTRG